MSTLSLETSKSYDCKEHMFSLTGDAYYVRSTSWVAAPARCGEFGHCHAHGYPGDRAFSALLAALLQPGGWSAALHRGAGAQSRDSHYHSDGSPLRSARRSLWRKAGRAALS